MAAVADIGSASGRCRPRGKRAGKATRPKGTTRIQRTPPRMVRLPWHHDSERTFMEWLDRNGIKAVFEPGVIAVPDMDRGTLPDYYLPDFGVYVELTMLNKFALADPQTRAQRRSLERLEEKWERLERLRRTNVGYVLVTGDLYHGIVTNKPWAIDRFMRLVRRESQKSQVAAAA